MDAEHDDMNVASSTSSTPVDVSATLKRAKDKFKTTLVSKDDDLIYDIGNLYAFDSHPVDAAALKADHSEYLKSTARDNVQLLLAKLFVLPTQRLDSAGVLALLPPPTMRIPREKPIPKPKAATKWEEYAQLKGIQKKKKGRMVYDEDFGEWRPRWGYKRANNTLDKDNWVIESNSKQTAEDPFLQAAQEKKSRIVKQKKQEDRNKRSAAATQIRANAAAFSTEVTSAIKVTPGDERRRRERGLIDGTLGKTRHSTASLGRFDPLLAKEKPLKPIRQKFDPVEKSAADESSRNLKMLDRILTPQEGRMNVEKAIKHSKKPKRKQANSISSRARTAT